MTTSTPPTVDGVHALRHAVAAHDASRPSDAVRG